MFDIIDIFSKLKKIRRAFGRYILPLLVFSLAFVCFITCYTPPPITYGPVTIVSPYSGVNWATYGQYKTSLHMHSTNSDGEFPLSEMLEDHYKKGFDIVAATDHNFLTVDWVSVNNGLTQARFDEISSGEGRSGRGMLQIPYTDEQSQDEDVNTYLTNFNNSPSTSFEECLKQVDKLGGLSQLNHLGQYTGGSKGGLMGEAASNNEKTIKKYVDLFMKYRSCVGMEIRNAFDDRSQSDRILWDNILARTIPQNRYVWGFSNDDTHDKYGTGWGYNVFVMPENNLENFRSTMMNGNFYAVSKVAKRELGSSFSAKGELPSILSIETDPATGIITINAKNFTKIDWISGNKTLASGKTINLNEHKSLIKSYVRANIIGPGGIAFTQPFGVNFE